MNVHDLHFDEDFLAFARHDNSSIGNVQVIYHGEPKNPLAVDVEVVHDVCIYHQNAFGDFVEIGVCVEATLLYFIHMGLLKVNNN
jgi:hypothetical protein